MDQFDENAKQIYLNIKAPDSLREKVLNNSEIKPNTEKEKTVNFKVIKRTLAACAVLAIVFSVLLVSLGRTSKLIVSGETVGNEPVQIAYLVAENSTAKSSRTINCYRIPIDLKAHGKATVEITNGQIIDGEDSAKKVYFSGERNLIWEISPAELNDGVVLTMTSFIQTEKYFIVCDENGNLCIAKEK